MPPRKHPYRHLSSLSHALASRTCGCNPWRPCLAGPLPPPPANGCVRVWAVEAVELTARGRVLADLDKQGASLHCRMWPEALPGSPYATVAKLARCTTHPPQLAWPPLNHHAAGTSSVAGA